MLKHVAAAVVLVMALSACGDDSVPGPNTAEVPSWAKVAPEQIAEAKKHGVPVAFENDLGMRFVLIPAGFRPQLWEGWEGRAVTVVAPFYLQSTDVTKGQYQGYGATVGGWFPSGVTVAHEDDPVLGIRWESKVAYAQWLSGRDSRRTYRMPTQDEFMCASMDGAMMPSNLGVTATSREAAQPGFRLILPLPGSSK